MNCFKETEYSEGREKCLKWDHKISLNFSFVQDTAAFCTKTYKVLNILPYSFSINPYNNFINYNRILLSMLTNKKTGPLSLFQFTSHYQWSCMSTLRSLHPYHTTVPFLSIGRPQRYCRVWFQTKKAISQ